jgi:ABC-2 type transport system ATP-binding protein
VIRVRHLHHKYGTQAVLDDVSFEVGAGEIFGFVGPNGAGKTTTIRILATLLEPTAGRVEIDGVDVVLEPHRVRRVLGYMPDHAGLYEVTTVREYLEFFSEAFGVGHSVVGGVMELTDIAPLATRGVANLSKGQKQRLQLARILLHDPKVLVLDEPASDLDPRARIELRDLLIELRRLGKTIFLSSHILTELADLCTSVAILEHGKLIAAGSIAEIARRVDERPSSDGITRHRVKIRVLGTPEQLRAAITPLGVEFEPLASGSGAAAWITYAGGERELAEIVRQIAVAGLAVVSVEPERSDLEKAFLKLTRGELQ